MVDSPIQAILMVVFVALFACINGVLSLISGGWRWANDTVRGLRKVFKEMHDERD